MPLPYSTCLRNKRILVADDSYFIAQELAALLEREGAIVIGPASTVDGAQRLAVEHSHLDAGVLDVNLRGEMIWPVADVLLQRQVRLVFATGYPAALIKARYKNGMVAEKPVPARMIVRFLIVQFSVADEI